MTMAVVPLMNTMDVVGAIVVALAIVGATCPVDATPKMRLPRVVLVPMTVVFDPRPRASVPPITTSLVTLSPLALALNPI